MTTRSRSAACCFTMVDPNPGYEVGLQPLVRAGPLLRRLHDRAVAVRGGPLGGPPGAQGPALPAGQPGRRAGGRRLLPVDLLDPQGQARGARRVGGCRRCGTGCTPTGGASPSATHRHTTTTSSSRPPTSEDDGVPVELALRPPLPGPRRRLRRAARRGPTREDLHAGWTRRPSRRCWRPARSGRSRRGRLCIPAGTSRRPSPMSGGTQLAGGASSAPTAAAPTGWCSWPSWRGRPGEQCGTPSGSTARRSTPAGWAR